MVSLAGALGTSRPAPTAAPVPSVRALVAKPAPLGTQETPSRAPRRLTANQTAFYAAVESVPALDALQLIRSARTADSTKGTYRAAVPLYEVACAKVGLAPWPPSQDTLYLFAGYLKVSMAFAAPATYWWAIVDEARERRCSFCLDRDWAKGVIVGLERGLAQQEQASSLTVPVLRLLGAKASTSVDFNTVMGLVCALFTVTRVDFFLTLGTDDIQDVGGDKVRVMLSKLKGERKRQFLDPVCERLPSCAGEFRPILTPAGVIPLCPVGAFCLLRDRAVKAWVSRVAKCNTCQTLIRCLLHLCNRAGFPQHDPGRTRRLCTAHSTRVVGVCYVLRAGVPESVVSILANWSSNQVQRYADRLALDPGLVSPWAFFNPSANAMHVGSVRPPPSKRRRT